MNFFRNEFDEHSRKIRKKLARKLLENSDSMEKFHRENFMRIQKAFHRNATKTLPELIENSRLVLLKKLRGEFEEATVRIF